MRVLITGVSGFVGMHLARHLRSQGHTVYGTYFSKRPADRSLQATLIRCDVRNARYVRAVLRKVRPHRIFHLAAQSSPTKSANDLAGVLRSNFWGTANILEALREGPATNRLL